MDERVGATDTDVENVRSEVSAILLSASLANSAALAEVLIYLRDRYPDRGTDPTTEYSIAQDVLNRDGTFDPKEDPVVRVRIARLRKAIADYYRTNPREIEVHIPARSYDLALRTAPHRALAKPRWRWPNATAAGLAAVAFLVVGLLSIQNLPADDHYPLIKILPMQNLSQAQVDGVFDRGLQRQIATDLQKFGRFRIFLADPPDRDLNDADFTLRGTILSLDDEVDIVFRLERGADESLIYGNRLTGFLLGDDYYTVIADISREISGQIAGQGGPLMRNITALPAPQLAGAIGRRGSGTNVFQCIALEDRFFDNYDPHIFMEASRCFESVEWSIVDDPVALTSWTTLQYHAVPEFDMMDTTQLPDAILNRGEDILVRAEEIAKRFPQSPEALLLLGAIESSIGFPTRAEVTLRQSIDLNPGNPIAHSVLAYLSLTEERFETAINLSNEAIRLSAEPQSFMYLPLFLSHLVMGNESAALAAGRNYVDGRTGDGVAAVRLIVSRLSGDSATEADLSVLVEDMENPLRGFSQFANGRTREVLAEFLPETNLSDN